VITADGFDYQGELYKSLSPIACRITGTHWSVPLPRHGISNMCNQRLD
jgi:hypothetical protein